MVASSIGTGPSPTVAALPDGFQFPIETGDEMDLLQNSNFI